jgi:hypothetical protein
MMLLAPADGTAAERRKLCPGSGSDFHPQDNLVFIEPTKSHATLMTSAVSAAVLVDDRDVTQAFVYVDDRGILWIALVPRVSKSVRDFYPGIAPGGSPIPIDWYRRPTRNVLPPNTRLAACGAAPQGA